MTTKPRAPIDATRVWEAAETLEAILRPGADLVHTKRLGWLLRQLESRPFAGTRTGSKTVYVDIDTAPDGQLGALLIRYQRRVRGQ